MILIDYMLILFQSVYLLVLHYDILYIVFLIDYILLFFKCWYLLIIHCVFNWLHVNIFQSVYLLVLHYDFQYIMFTIGDLALSSNDSYNVYKYLLFFLR